MKPQSSKWNHSRPVRQDGALELELLRPPGQAASVVSVLCSRPSVPGLVGDLVV